MDFSSVFIRFGHADGGHVTGGGAAPDHVRPRGPARVLDRGNLGHEVGRNGVNFIVYHLQMNFSNVFIQFYHADGGHVAILVTRMVVT